jgi:hypothetical protein
MASHLQGNYAHIHDAGCRESDDSRQHDITLRLRYTILMAFHGKTPKLSLGSLPIFDSLSLYYLPQKMSKAHKVILTAEFATSPAGEVIPEIESPERIALALEYWNANQEQEFLAHGYFFCIGTLCILGGGSSLH